MALWVILILVMAAVRANRNPRAWLVFIPLLAVNLLWTLLKKIMPLPSSAMSMFDQLFVSLTMGISIVLLFGHKIGNRNRFITFLLAMFFMAGVGVAGAISYSGLTFSPEAFAAAIMFAVLTLAMLLAFVFASCCCRKRYGGLRFMLWLAVWTVGICAVIVLGYFGIAMVIISIVSDIPGGLISVLLGALGVSLGLGGCLYVIILPFMILAMRSCFFRERFYACLRLKSMASEDLVTGTEPESQQDPLKKQGDNDFFQT